MTQEECMKAALRRPRNYFTLPPMEQWGIDRSLGILDWEGPTTEEEKKAIEEHHGIQISRG